ncbi:TetR/AcrR family transcriptional regulator [Streptomyces sp. NBC_01506]|uniref:TetR/AcrR family transcriptional regulator n=1 Tax=Streptomyces sp. NBC_01506 TaxID=2903887 RepID=UPI00386646DD
MGRPPAHDPDSLLDAALSLAAGSGPAAVTMAAVARRAGAPSGSVYHRFAKRPDLLSALWLRTVSRFQDDFLAALDTSAVAAARHVVEFSRARPDEARVLVRGARDFGEPDWDATARDELRRLNRRVEAALGAAAVRLACDVERVVLATVDLPLAAVRRPLLAGDDVPETTAALVSEGAAALLRPSEAGPAMDDKPPGPSGD